MELIASIREKNMQIGIVGLGRMGANMARRLMRSKHEVAVYDLKQESVATLAKEGAIGANDFADLAKKLTKPRSVWLMVPAGTPTEETIEHLRPFLESGDTIIDGGNSFYKDDVRRSDSLKKQGIHYLDAGTSGGVWGIERGYCLMIGGDEGAVKRLEPIFEALAPGQEDIAPSPGRENIKSTAEKGFLYCGPSGAGHFVKMIHNGIEYGVMQAYAEGFDILRGAGSDALPDGYRYNFNAADIAELWRRGSVVGSWLLDLTAMALAEDPALNRYTGVVQDSGEGRWTIQAAIEEAISAEVLTAALFVRFRSRQEHTFAEKMLSAMRNKFGGHVEIYPGN
jgi:6-phosphogluconate dehydrogenase